MQMYLIQFSFTFSPCPCPRCQTPGVWVSLGEKGSESCPAATLGLVPQDLVIGEMAGLVIFVHAEALSLNF